VFITAVHTYFYIVVDTQRGCRTIKNKIKIIPTPFWRPRDGNFIAIYKKGFGFCASNMEKWPSHYQMGNTNAQPVQGMVNNEHETHDHMKHCLDSRLGLLGMTFHQNQSSMGLKKHATCQYEWTKQNILWEENHTGNSSSSDKSTGIININHI